MQETKKQPRYSTWPTGCYRNAKRDDDPRSPGAKIEMLYWVPNLTTKITTAFLSSQQMPTQYLIATSEHIPVAIGHLWQLRAQSNNFLIPPYKRLTKIYKELFVHWPFTPKKRPINQAHILPVRMSPFWTPQYYFGSPHKTTFPPRGSQYSSNLSRHKTHNIEHGDQISLRQVWKPTQDLHRIRHPCSWEAQLRSNSPPPPSRRSNQTPALVSLLHIIYSYMFVQRHSNKINPLMNVGLNLQYISSKITSSYYLNSSQIIEQRCCKGTLKKFDPIRNYHLFHRRKKRR